MFFVYVVFLLGSVLVGVISAEKAKWMDVVISACAVLLFGLGAVMILVGWRKESLMRRRINELLQAADAGDAQAQYRVAGMLSKIGLDADALRYYAAAAEAGHADAMFCLGVNLLPGVGAGCREDEEKGIAWLRCADAAGSEDAAEWLAPIYEHGTDFTPADAEEARYWYSRAATRGSEAATEKLRQLATGRAEA